ncbi:2-amino-4-hydroxy-6-hydroxymethyldihydropteridine diphosphokinase [Comamonas sp. BIGb0152]|uniref:2-amino-4-hydroxy-6- hydroxymethyldihydropteridine diphosphokinase n=1 Tax=Comamonas sp. BIGb0152 TaxID=2940601 RepID=UPI0021688BCC|nr:2-amino-4-hydroxy-6-hydroxymethyldihydropteridine diphosphokinase [Comamonas sp. BIGb0152]MCS4293484.1 2-amino-4-hydroxy-6-hydroxymethyldihydropteridine diphosphokinase [Comamonas sp. BIGb0152]
MAAALPLAVEAERLASGDAAPPAGQALPVWIGLGANLGDRGEALRLALQQLDASAGVAVQAVSSLYASRPVDSSGPDYLNAVAELRTALSAHQLLRLLQQLELDAGRERPYRNAPRTLDLDVLLYGSRATVIAMPDLELPHPRMWQRAFVLAPLQELQPAWVSDAQLQPLLAQGVQRSQGPGWWR